MYTIISAGLGVAMIVVAHVPSCLAFPTYLFWTGNLPEAKGTVKADVGAARPAALGLVTAPAAEPIKSSKSSQGEEPCGGKSGQGGQP